MPLGRNGSKRTSEREVALVQMQIAAQARNQRWHDFLCAKRDEMQARLRQQGYSQRAPEGPRVRSQDEGRGQLLEPYDIGPGLAAQSGTPPETSTRWSATGREESVVQSVETDGGDKDDKDDKDDTTATIDTEDMAEFVETEETEETDVQEAEDRKDAQASAWWADRDNAPL